MIEQSTLHQRISDSFNAQGLMKTLGAEIALVSDGEVRIALPFSALLAQQRGYMQAPSRASSTPPVATLR